ncbi:MAG: serine/threonine protein phosphatase [Bordetella sp. SCN 67-23]|nr:metallophosphoesterase [Burkholderiales bacterium]ODS74739.1 MAG: serine/threonine protein phosphatase [Bordetella sp. SCN 67-23]OJW88837.1 MAG: serine/threonine protein phosphatase [Burkholderiales bacterium 67-32]
MTALLVRHELNRHGRDIAVGDIHGHFTRLRAALDRAGFDPATDRLFSVGDLVDRGPESGQVLDWLALPWFHAVRGNHEDIAIRYAKGNPVDQTSYIANGGAWFVTQPLARRHVYAEAFARLPLAREIETQVGLVGIVHADSPVRDWSRLAWSLRLWRAARDRAMWSRDRLQDENASGVAGLRALVVGHTPVDDPVVLGNVHHIDTGGWMPNGRFTLLDLATLQAIPPIS